MATTAEMSAVHAKYGLSPIEEAIRRYEQCKAAASILSSERWDEYAIAAHALKYAHDDLARILKTGHGYRAANGSTYGYSRLENSVVVVPSPGRCRKIKVGGSLEICVTPDPREEQRQEFLRIAQEDRDARIQERLGHVTKEG